MTLHKSHVLRLLLMLALLVAVALPSLADPIVRRYTGTVAGDAAAFTLSFNDGMVTGSYHLLANVPAKLRDNTLTGNLSGNHLQLSETAALAVYPSATIQGDFDASPLLNADAPFTGTRALNTDGLTSKPVTLKPRPFGPATPSMLSEKQISVTGPKNRYVVTGEYPLVVGDATGRYVKFNAAAKSLIDDRVRWFGKFETSGTNPDANTSRKGPDTMDVHYEILDFTPKLVSMRYIMYLDTGGAHPNAATVTLNYDLIGERTLALSDLFDPASNYLHIIAVATISTLSHESDADYDMLVAGANSKASNYQNWNLTSDGLIFTFDPYQVGPYSSGIQRFRFPLGSLPPTKAVVAFVP